MSAFVPAMAYAQETEYFLDLLETTAADFTNQSSEGYVPARYAVSPHAADIENMGGTIGYAVHRAGGWYNEKAYIKYKVRPDSKIVVKTFDCIDGYDISFEYSDSNGDTKAIYGEKTYTYTLQDRNSNNYDAADYILIMPSNAEYFTIYLPDAATEDDPLTPLYTNWQIGVVSVEMMAEDFKDSLDSEHFDDGGIRQRVSSRAVKYLDLGGEIGGTYTNEAADNEFIYYVSPYMNISAYMFNQTGSNAKFMTSQDMKSWQSAEFAAEDGKLLCDKDGNEYKTQKYSLQIPMNTNYLKIILPESNTDGAAGLMNISSKKEMGVDANIYWNDVHQEIDGFGGALQTDGTHHIQHHPELIDFMFDPVDGLGFSIVRTVVPTEERSDGEGPLKAEGEECDWTKDASQVWALQKIQKYPDVKTVACSWTPLYYMKDNKQQSGGTLLPEYYQEYAEFFADYIEGYKEQHGINIDILSVQNEPESAPGWGSCIMDGNVFHKFTKENLIPEFEKRGITTELMLGDFANFRFPKSNFPYLTDEETRDDVDYISGHSYWGICDRFPYGKELLKKIWQTETSDTNTADDPSIEYGLSWAEEVHVLLTQPEVNGFLFWYLVHRYSNCEALITCNCQDGYTVNKRCWVFGNYSKFIRPGYYRIGADESPDADAFISAYKDEETGKCVAVCINDSTETKVYNFRLNDFQAETVTGHRTSATENLENIGTFDVKGSEVSLTLAPRSVTSFVFDGCSSDLKSGKLEAETNSAKLGNGQNIANKDFSGGKGVKNIGAKDNGVIFDHLAAANSVSIRYKSLNSSDVTYKLYINDEFIKNVVFPSTVAAGSTVGDVHITEAIPEDGSIKLLSEQDSDGIFIDYLKTEPNTAELELLPMSNVPQDYTWAADAVSNIEYAGNITIEDEADMITRGEYVKLLIEILGVTAEWMVNFFDVYNAKDYYTALGTARENGIVPENEDNLFYPDDFLSREDMFIFTANALKLKGYADKGTTDISVFDDWDRMSDDGKEAAKLLISNGIISGTGSSLNPNRYVNYASAAVVLDKICG